MKIKLSKSQWEEAGKKAGWMKTAQSLVHPIHDFDREHYTKPILHDNKDWGFLVDFVDNAIKNGKTLGDFKKELDRLFIQYKVDAEDINIMTPKAIEIFKSKTDTNQEE